MVWLFATLSEMSPSALLCAVRPLMAAVSEPKRDMRESSGSEG
jgi:hypothetical protein